MVQAGRGRIWPRCRACGVPTYAWAAAAPRSLSVSVSVSPLRCVQCRVGGPDTWRSRDMAHVRWGHYGPSPIAIIWCIRIYIYRVADATLSELSQLFHLDHRIIYYCDTLIYQGVPWETSTYTYQYHYAKTHRHWLPLKVYLPTNLRGDDRFMAVSLQTLILSKWLGVAVATARTSRASRLLRSWL